MKFARLKRQGGAYIYMGFVFSGKRWRFSCEQFSPLRPPSPRVELCKGN